MPIQSLSHYNIRADLSTIAALRDFYTEVVGLRDGDRPPFSAPGYWLYADRFPVLHLSVAAEGEDIATRNGGLIDHAAFACADVDEFSNRLEAAAVEFDTRMVPETDTLQLFFRDPAGNGVELQFDATAE